MPDIEHELPINAPIDRVYAAVATPAGLDTWWTLTSAGVPVLGDRYTFDFGPRFVWKGTVTRCAPNEIEWTLDDADSDWLGTTVGLALAERDGLTILRFAHRGWRDANTHYRVSSCCWAMYLRILRRSLEHGEMVPYERRLDV
jgi:uncharacterized protein YndB with AHSA1/START domain